MSSSLHVLIPTYTILFSIGYWCVVPQKHVFKPITHMLPLWYPGQHWNRYHVTLLVFVGWFNVPLTARSFRDGTPIYCPLRRTWSSINTPFRPGIEPRAVAWQSITLPLRYPHYQNYLKYFLQSWKCIFITCLSI